MIEPINKMFTKILLTSGRRYAIIYIVNETYPPQRKGRYKIMMNFVEKIENFVIRKYGFENYFTVLVFHICSMFRRSQVKKNSNS